jgi:hypothetical protein
MVETFGSLQPVLFGAALQATGNGISALNVKYQKDAVWRQRKDYKKTKTFHELPSYNILRNLR